MFRSSPPALFSTQNFDSSIHVRLPSSHSGYHVPVQPCTYRLSLPKLFRSNHPSDNTDRSIFYRVLVHIRHDTFDKDSDNRQFERIQMVISTRIIAIGTKKPLSLFPANVIPKSSPDELIGAFIFSTFHLPVLSKVALKISNPPIPGCPSEAK